jgi:multidrug efflux pump subunit AcrA (membrane-fusion protein)
VEASKPNPEVKPGMTVEVSMTGKTVKDAIVVPAGAIFKNAEGGTDYVVLAGSDQKAHWKTVQVGVRNGEDAQIISGINAGDPIVSTGGYALPDNTKIKIEAAAAPEKEEGGKAGKAEKDSKAEGSAKPDDKKKE